MEILQNGKVQVPHNCTSVQLQLVEYTFHQYVTQIMNL